MPSTTASTSAAQATGPAKAVVPPVPLVPPPLDLHDGRDDFNVIFIHSRLDDYGLSPQQFRIYAHIARRSGSGAAWPSVATVAQVCQLHPKTARQALHVLVEHRLITRELRPGTTPIYRITPAREWHPPTNIKADPSQTDTLPKPIPGTPPKRIQGYPSHLNTVEGNTIEGNPVKEYPCSPQSGDCVPAKGFSTLAQAADIYAAYPRKVGKPAAVRAIQRALRTYPVELLLERTTIYATICGSVPMAQRRFIPHPATWFNRERFNDDQETWLISASTNGKAPPAIIRADQFRIGVSKL